VRRVSLQELQERLGRGGQVDWLDRGATQVADLRSRQRLAIVGRSQSGKTREALELMRRAVQQGLLAEDRILEPGPAFRLLSEEGLRAALRPCPDPPAAVLLFVDDLPARFYGRGLKQLDEALAALQECPLTYVLATARSEQLTADWQAWLGQQRFEVAELRDLNAEEAAALLDAAAARIEVALDGATRDALVAGQDGTSGWALGSLRRLRMEGGAKADGTAAHRIAQESMTATWAALRREIREEAPAVGPVLDSLATFYAAGVVAGTPLVLHYAARLWREGHGWRRLWPAMPALRRALAALAQLDVVACGGRVSCPEAAVEGVVAPEEAWERLATFLEKHRQRFHNRWLRWLYRDAATQRQALFDLALAAQERQDWAAADRCIAVALRVRPHPGLYIDRGNMHAERGDLKAAISDYDRAIDLDPRDASLYLYRGVARRAQGDLAAAIPDLDRAVRLDPGYARAYGNRANAHYERGDLEAAIADYGQAVALFKDRSDRAMAYNNRGLAHRAHGDLEAAIADYERAISLFPDGPDKAMAYNNRGMVRRAQGDLKAAIANYDRAIELDPQLAEAYGNRANARYEQGHLVAAIADYNEALERNPQLAEAFTNRGNARYERGEWEAAIADYTAAIELSPQSSYPYVGRGLARQREGKLEAAVADYDRAIQLDAEYAMAYINRASAHYERGDLEAAIADYDRAISLLPDGLQRARAYNDRGSARKALGDLEAAIADYSRAIELNPQDAGAYRNRGNARSAQGDLEAAIADYDRAIERNSRDATAYYNRGLAFKERGESEKAVADWQRVLRFSSDAHWRAQAEEQLKELEGA
jgi:tetratricopeptide (TPR) repeat protein